MRKSRLVSICIIIILTIIITVPIYALANATLSEKAVTLNKLSILFGSNGDYNFDGKLKRSEAAAFIARIIGKEAYIIENSKDYKFTKFPDVDSNQWYAPYIGYCTSKNIIVGYPNGDFGPNDNISEKAFLKMIIEALGYAYGSDYNWSNIYQIAYSLGLVTDSSYEVRTSDNSNYLRKNVIEVLFNSLTTKIKDNSARIIDRLIQDGIVTKDLAISNGVITDAIVTSIEQVSALNTNKVSLKFNEKVRDINLADIKIYESNDFTKTLTVEIESKSEDGLVIKTAEQVIDRQYTAEIHNITDMSGNITAVLLGTFKGYRNPEIKSDFFKISKIEPVSKNVINLYFTHPITVNSELASYYTILENGNSFIQGSTQSIIVKRLNAHNNAVSIYLKDKVCIEGMEYTLNVSGDMTSTYGVKLMDEAGDSIPFKGNGQENLDLNISGILPLNSTSIQVEFNKEIDPNFAEKYLNYSIIASDNSVINVSKAIVGGYGEKKGRSVILTLTSPLDKTKIYELKIEYIFDIFKQSALESVRKTFSGVYPDKTDLSIIFTMVNDKGTVSVYFNRPLNADYAGNNLYYMIMGVSETNYLSVPVKAYYSEYNGYYIAKLYLPDDKPLKSSYAYKVVVLNSLQDVYGNMQIQNVEYKFNGISNDIVKPSISDAVIISKDTIRVNFKRELAYEVPNILPANYTLKYNDNGSIVSKIPISVTYIDADTLALKFDSLNSQEQYTLKYNSLKDYSGIYNVNSANTQNGISVTYGK